MSIIKSIKMICSNIDGNNNKFWNADLHDDEQIYVTYGRVGYSGQSEGPFPGGQAFLDKKIKEKKKKGYIEFDGIPVSSTKTTISVVSNLKEVAKQQIKYNSPELEKLIDRLVKSNIHNITSSTQITYDSNTGLFSTPLGIVTKDSIEEARNLLALIKHAKDNNSKIEDQHINKYLMLIPHNFGMIKVKDFVKSMDFIKELNTLDSLEASYTTVLSKDKTDKTNDSPVVEEQIFNLSLDVLPNKDKEFVELNKWFETSKKKQHGYDNIHIKNIYTVSIKENRDLFEKQGKSYGNITKVFHGTSEANLLSILKSGMKVSPPSTAYIAGKMFGNGVYGAVQSSKALGYTLGRWGGSTTDSGWLFICNFAMGKTYNPTNTGSPPSGYDSVWARSGDCNLYHDELIVYKNSQIEITHLIEVNNK